MTGARAPENWANETAKTDFFDIKSEVEQLLHLAGEHVLFRPSTRPGLHDGQTAEVCLGDQVVGVLGAIHPTTAEAMNLPASTYIAELKLSAVTRTQLPAYVEISRFPETRRDIAVVVQEDTPAAAIEVAVREAAGAGLADLRIFDVYAGQGIEPGHKSLALGLTFRDQSRTLDDSEISSVMTQVIDSLKEKLNAQLRG
jgi:phenylalanyl-tRNA synthetase beta chain